MEKIEKINVGYAAWLVLRESISRFSPLIALCLSNSFRIFWVHISPFCTLNHEGKTPTLPHLSQIFYNIALSACKPLLVTRGWCPSSSINLGEALFNDFLSHSKQSAHCASLNIILGEKFVPYWGICNYRNCKAAEHGSFQSAILNEG